MCVAVQKLCFSGDAGAFSERVTSSHFVCLPVLAVLDALSQRGSLAQRGVSTTAGTGGQDAILKEQKRKKNKQKTGVSNLNAALRWRRLAL